MVHQVINLGVSLYIAFGDAAAFSFCQDKIMTTGGEGGMLTTNSREVWEKAWSYKEGKTSQEVELGKFNGDVTWPGGGD